MCEFSCSRSKINRKVHEMVDPKNHKRRPWNVNKLFRFCGSYLHVNEDLLIFIQSKGKNDAQDADSSAAAVGRDDQRGRCKHFVPVAVHLSQPHRLLPDDHQGSGRTRSHHNLLERIQSQWSAYGQRSSIVIAGPRWFQQWKTGAFIWSSDSSDHDFSDFL